MNLSYYPIWCIYIYIYINIKEALALLFSCEFYKISKNTFSYRTTPMAASDVSEWIYTQQFYNFLLETGAISEV